MRPFEVLYPVVMRLACRWFLGCGVLALGGCFDPGQPINDTGSSDDSSGNASAMSSTAGTTPTTQGPTTPDTGATDTQDPDSGTDDTATTSPPMQCDGNGVDPACPGSTPFCEDGLCVDCSGLPEDVCMGVDVATPICDAGACTACTAHDQCGTGACRFTTGECFAAANRLWADNTFGGCAGGVGSEENPVCEVVDAMEIINGQAGMEPWAIMVAGSPNDYVGTVDPDQNRPVAIIGPSAGLAATLNNDSAYTIDLWAQSPETYLHRLSLDRGSGGPTIRCNTGQVYVTDSNMLGGDTTVLVSGCAINLERVAVNTNGMGAIVTGGSLYAEEVSFDNSSGGLRIEGGSAELHRSVVSNNYVEGGIHVQGGELLLVNSIVFNNQYQNDGLHVMAGGMAEVVHSTLIGAFTCSNMAGPTTVRNSIVMGGNFDGGMACSSSTVHNSVVNAGLAQGVGNVMVSGDDLGSIFVNSGGGMLDYHVLPGSIPDGVAVHQAGDPVVDYDLDPRTEMAGAVDYAGADVP